MAIVHVTGENYEKEVLQSDKPVLIDFWASWCGPCQMLGPVIEEVSEEVPVEYKVINSDGTLSQTIGTCPAGHFLLEEQDAKAERQKRCRPRGVFEPTAGRRGSKPAKVGRGAGS